MKIYVVQDSARHEDYRCCGGRFSRGKANRWLFQFATGCGSPTYILTYAYSLESALEDAAAKLLEVAPGLFSDEEDAVDEAGGPVDHTYTESGWLPSWEWYVDEDPANETLRNIYHR